MAKQLLGKEVTAALNERIKANVAELQGKGVNPTLCIIRVGENPSDISYEKGATKRCETLGVACEKILLPGDVSQEELLTTIDKVNKDDHIHGVLLFRPLPKHLDQAVIENALAAEKDVDCFSPLNTAKLMEGDKSGFPPCTPTAVVEILKELERSPPVPTISNTSISLRSLVQCSLIPAAEAVISSIVSPFMASAVR